MSPTSGNTDTANPTDSGDTWEKLHGRPAAQPVGWMIAVAMTLMIGAGAFLMSIAPPQPPQPRPAPTTAAPPPLDPLAPREYSEAENRAAFEQYTRQLVETQHNAIGNSLWRQSLNPALETTLQFAGGKSATFTRRFNPNPQVDRTSTYIASYERTGERYRFRFEDGSVLTATSMLLGDHLMFRQPVVEGSGAAAAAAEIVKFGFMRQP